VCEGGGGVRERRVGMVGSLVAWSNVAWVR
jgi:hypothetical protein